MSRIEERIPAEHFGARWAAHAKRTWRLVPFVW
jgi:protein-S-isoprenylcysteine O-methyltransferase